MTDENTTETRRLLRKLRDFTDRLDKIYLPKEPYEEEIKETLSNFDMNLEPNAKTMGYWLFISYPMIPEDYEANEVDELERLRDVIEVAKVKKDMDRSFPFTFNKTSGYFPKGRLGFYSSENYIEGHYAFQNGLFLLKKIFEEDLRDQKSDSGNNALCFGDTIELIAKYLTFLKKFYKDIPQGSNVHFKIILDKVMNREFIPSAKGESISQGYISFIDNIKIEEDLNIEELFGSFNAVANRIIRFLLLMFNISIDEETINEWLSTFRFV